ncbi:hypothetical protein [Burkholderia seminalis]|uniref:hypothetical protein n=1 Tax=Burkholderia seminalis TaxID=488731 RepID=UPI000AEC61AB|nr:hypothetical protein [Burkholderia seminalis]MCA8044254.1 hypothetical protein [Burkholderia seminalis]
MKLARRRFVLIGARVMAAYAADAELSFLCRFIVGKMPRVAGRRPGHEKGEAACRAAKNEQRKEILRAWLTDVHPDDVVASGEGFNAWLISVTHGYVDVDRLKTVASMIPVLNNLMALADALTDIVDRPQARRRTARLSRTRDQPDRRDSISARTGAHAPHGAAASGNVDWTIGNLVRRCARSASYNEPARYICSNAADAPVRQLIDVLSPPPR